MDAWNDAVAFVEEHPWVFAIATGVLTAGIVWALAAIFKPIRRGLAGLGRLLWAGLKWLCTIRVTTSGRIQRRISTAVAKSHEPPAWAGWVVRRTSSPGMWHLVNATSEKRNVLECEFDSNFSVKTPPVLPRRLPPGGHVFFVGNRNAKSTSMLGPGAPVLRVRWSDAHGDQAWSSGEISHEAQLFDDML